MVKQLRVKNFRSIEDSGLIDIKPITVFLGKNSCGKSSFIRILPLLKQSLEKEKHEPLLWYGDYIDFGGFSEIMPKNKKDIDCFELDFTLDLSNRYLDHHTIRNIIDYIFYRSNEFSGSLKNLIIDVKIEFHKREIKLISLNYLCQKINIQINNERIESIQVNNNNSIDVKRYKLIYTGRDLLPELEYQFSERNYMVNNDILSGFVNPIIEDLQNKTKCRIADKTWQDFITRILRIQSKNELLEQLRQYKASAKIRQYFEGVDIEDELLNSINDRIQFILLPYVIKKVNQSIHSYIENLYYIKPIRANANRYYRIQGIGVKQVDPDGSNLPMILYNLPEKRRNRFSRWCKDQLGISFSVKETEGHISLMVNTGGDYEINIADSGYGYSQVLPIILQIWLLIENNKETHFDITSSYTILIEQPELHLHPAFQAKLAEMFVSFINSLKEKNSNVNIIFETHSDVIVNRLGTLVLENKINKDDINLVLVEKKEGVSKFKQVGFASDGLINEWPIGFMSPEA